MKTASSIRYGGMLVDSSECDYDSFKHLGLLCPICKRTVFLVREAARSASTRKNKDGSLSSVKACNVPSYFAHHPEVDKNIVNDCELRSNQISVRERVYLETKAHNQRQKIFHAHFWKILQTSFFLREPEECVKYVRSVYVKACVNNERKAIFMFQELINTVIHKYRKIDENSWIDFVKDRVEVAEKRILDNWIGTSKDLHEDYQDALTDAEEAEIKKENDAWLSEVDRRMQSKIVVEAILFLQQKQQVKLLEILLQYCLDRAINQIIAIQHKTLPSLGSQEYAKMYHWYMRQMIGATDHSIDIVFSYMKIALIDVFVSVRWAYQFEMLEQKALERSTLKLSA